jgi:TatD DNase family protein
VKLSITECFREKMGERSLRLFDAHCHLQSPRLAPHLDAALAAAVEAGVVACAVNATCEADWQDVLDLAARQSTPALRPSLGVHPWHLHTLTPGWEGRLRAALITNPSAGVGESGLDRAPKGLASADEALQAAALSTHIALALDLHRPLSLHCVRATGALTELLTARAPFPAGVVLHAWHGSADATRRLAQLEGVHFSVGARQLLAAPPRVGEGVAQPVSEKARAMLAAIPAGRLLVETDAPDGWVPGVGLPVVGGAPTPVNQTPVNHPATVARVVDLVAEATGWEVAAVAAASFRAAERVFGPS